MGSILSGQFAREGEIDVKNSAFMDKPEEFIKATDLKKQFDDVIAVNNISFSIREGELFGFLGPNGAGKTTTINMLTGLARPDSGTINIAGLDCTENPKAAQHLTGVVPDESNLYPELTGVDILHGSIHGQHMFPILMNFIILAGFCILLFYFSIRNTQEMDFVKYIDP